MLPPCRFEAHSFALLTMEPVSCIYRVTRAVGAQQGGVPVPHANHSLPCGLAMVGQPSQVGVYLCAHLGALRHVHTHDVCDVSRDVEGAVDQEAGQTLAVRALHSLCSIRYRVPLGDEVGDSPMCPTALSRWAAAEVHDIIWEKLAQPLAEALPVELEESLGLGSREEVRSGGFHCGPGQLHVGQEAHAVQGREVDVARQGVQWGGSLVTGGTLPGGFLGLHLWGGVPCWARLLCYGGDVTPDACCVPLHVMQGALARVLLPFFVLSCLLFALGPRDNCPLSWPTQGSFEGEGQRRCYSTA